jgi:hypothetical protein
MITTKKTCFSIKTASNDALSPLKVQVKEIERRFKSNDKEHDEERGH